MTRLTTGTEDIAVPKAALSMGRQGPILCSLQQFYTTTNVPTSEEFPVPAFVLG